MVFMVKFLRTDARLFERRIEWLPIEACDRDDAKSVFNKFLGIPFHYSILDISVLQYEK